MSQPSLLNEIRVAETKWLPYNAQKVLELLGTEYLRYLGPSFYSSLLFASIELMANVLKLKTYKNEVLDKLVLSSSQSYYFKQFNQKVITEQLTVQYVKTIRKNIYSHIDSSQSLYQESNIMMRRLILQMDSIQKYKQQLSHSDEFVYQIAYELAKILQVSLIYFKVASNMQVEIVCSQSPYCVLLLQSGKQFYFISVKDQNFSQIRQSLAEQINPVNRLVKSSKGYCQKCLISLTESSKFTTNKACGHKYCKECLDDLTQLQDIQCLSPECQKKLSQSGLQQQNLLAESSKPQTVQNIEIESMQCDACQKPRQKAELFNNPSCKHSYCLSCIQKKYSIANPVCLLRNCSHPLQQQQVDQFKKAYAAKNEVSSQNQQVNMKNQSQNIKAQQKICSVCGQTKDIREIFSNSLCPHNYCYDCIIKHNLNQYSYCMIKICGSRIYQADLNKFIAQLSRDKLQNEQDPIQSPELQKMQDWDKPSEGRDKLVQCDKCTKKFINDFVYYSKKCYHHICIDCLTIVSSNFLITCPVKICPCQLSSSDVNLFLQNAKQTSYYQNCTKCLKCNNILVEGTQFLKATICGHWICQSCFENYFKYQEIMQCPVKTCGQQLLENDFVVASEQMASDKAQANNHQKNQDAMESEALPGQPQKQMREKCAMCNTICNGNDPVYYMKGCNHTYCLKCAQKIFQDMWVICQVSECRNKFDYDDVSAFLRKNQLKKNQDAMESEALPKQLQKQVSEKCSKCNTICNEEDPVYHLKRCSHPYCFKCVQNIRDFYQLSQCYAGNCYNKFDYSDLSAFLRANEELFLKKSSERCELCSKEFPLNRLFKNFSCRHRFCVECLQGLFGSRTNSMSSCFTCKAHQCYSYIFWNDIENFLITQSIEESKSQLQNYKCSACSQEINLQLDKNTQLSYIKCPNPACRQITCVKHEALMDACFCLCPICLEDVKSEGNLKTCLKCRKQLCSTCRKVFDMGKSCPCKPQCQVCQRDLESRETVCDCIKKICCKCLLQFEKGELVKSIAKNCNHFVCRYCLIEQRQVEITSANSIQRQNFIEGFEPKRGADREMCVLCM